MERQHLVELLEQLHAALAQADRADPETLALLQTLTVDIERVLGQRADGEPEPTEDAEPVASGLQNLLLKFEADHPELAATIGKIADSLAAMGF
jgi:Domain of unknown function (DUF4404)